MESRFVDLEVRYSYLEQAVRDLDGVVLALRAEVERLRRRLEKLEEAAGGEPEDVPAHDEKPPHY
jgi:uncharacterized coiled-coil protein SlyX